MLNVVGVRRSFFSPRRTARRTSADEFHSVKNTLWPSARSQRCKSEICVDFPEPSMPSTMISFPGYGCGNDRPFIASLLHLQAHVHVEHLLEDVGLTTCRPELELRVVSAGADADPDVLAAAADGDLAYHAEMATVERVGYPQERSQRGDRGAHPVRQLRQLLVVVFRSGLAVVARERSDEADLLRVESQELPVHDQIVGMPVMPRVRNVIPDVVQQRRVLEPFALAIAETVAVDGLIEQRDGETRDLLAVPFLEVQPPAEVHHAAPARVGDRLVLLDLAPVPPDEIEHDTLAERPLARDELRQLEPPHDVIEQDRTGHDGVDATPIEPG